MQSEYWDRVAEAKDFNHPLNLPLFAAATHRDQLVVDVGCGYGRVLAQLKASGYRELLGIDASANMIARAAREHPDIQVRRADGHATGLADGVAGTVILFAVLTATPGDAQQQALIRECRRILRPGGVLYVSDLLLNDDDRNVRRYDRFEPRFGVRGVFELPDGGVMRHHDPRWVDSLLADFKPLHLERLTVETMNGNRSRAFQFLGRNAD